MRLCDKLKPEFISLERCEACPIRHRAVCARCDDKELAQLETMKTYKTFDVGDTIMWRGEPSEFVASVVEGVASLTKTMEDGRTQMVGLLLPSDFVGRPGRATVEFDVTAITKVTLCCFKRRPFEALVDSTPHVAQRLMELALDELDCARDWMVLLGRKSAREKIATFLCMLMKRSTENGEPNIGMYVRLPMTRDQISDYLGLTLETVSRQINSLKKQNIIELVDQKTMRVVDPRALLAATGDDIFDL